MSNSTEDYFYLRTKSEIISPKFAQSPTSLKVENQFYDAGSSIRNLEKDSFSAWAMKGDDPAERQHELTKPPQYDYVADTAQTNVYSSVDSSTNLILLKKSVSHGLKRVIKIMGMLIIVSLALQCGFFGALMGYLNHDDCEPLHALSLAVLITSGLGIMFGIWIVFARLVDTTRRSRSAAIIGTCGFVTQLALLIRKIILQGSLTVDTCIIGEKPKIFLSWDILLYSLITALVIEGLAMYFLWKVVFNKRKIDDLEKSEEKKTHMISQVARELLQ